MSKIIFHYWFLRGRGEAIRLALNLKGVEYEEKPPDYQSMKAGGSLSARALLISVRAADHKQGCERNHLLC
jgi:hypothetical protein